MGLIWWPLAFISGAQGSGQVHGPAWWREKWRVDAQLLCRRDTGWGLPLVIKRKQNPTLLSLIRKVQARYNKCNRTEIDGIESESARESLSYAQSPGLVWGYLSRFVVHID